MSIASPTARYRGRRPSGGVLTEKQRNILIWVAQTETREGVFPSYREIGDHFGVTKERAHQQSIALFKSGFLVRAKTARRLYRWDVNTDALRAELGEWETARIIQ